MNRRTLLTGLFCAAAAPAIVRASSLMPVKAPLKLEVVWNGFASDRYWAVWDCGLSNAEFNALHAGVCPLTIRPDRLATYVEAPRRNLLAV